MVTDRMTWNEISQYYCKVWDKLHKNNNYRKFLSRLKVDKYRKYNGGFMHMPAIKFEVGNSDDIYCMPVRFDGGGSLVSIYSPFRYKNRKYLAVSGSGEICDIYSWHSLIRYHERFRKVDISDLSTLNMYDAGIVVARNGNSLTFDFYLKNNDDFNFMSVCKDGAFLGYRDEKVKINKTFITRDMMFEMQKEMDEEMLAFLQDICLKIFGEKL